MKTYKTNAPLYEDPIWGGPTDPVVIWNRKEQEWWMLYTQRRSYGRNVGVSSVHGTDIGIASSPDGKEWLYRGIASGLAYEPGRNTYWAPEVLYAMGNYHMYVSYVRGVPASFTGTAKILHYTSEDLWNWHFESELCLGSDRVIDACVYEVAPHQYKMWYKDERRGSHTCSAYSEDLYHWTLGGEEITDCAQEGPNVFELEGKKWLIADCWDGQAVYESEDFIHWKRQEGNLLRTPGVRPMDQEMGNHADVVIKDGKGYIFYFVHPDFLSAQRSDPKFCMGEKQAHTVIQAARLMVEEGKLICNRDEDFEIFKS